MKYFISFAWQSTVTGQYGFGNSEVTLDNRITDEGVLNKVRDSIQNVVFNGNKNIAVTVLNFRRYEDV